MTAIQGDLLELLDALEQGRDPDTPPGWQCPHCGDRFSRSRAEVEPRHGDLWKQSAMPGKCAGQKLRLEMLMLRISPAWKRVAWRKHEDVVAKILEAKQAGISDDLLGRVLADERLHNFVLLEALLEGTQFGNDLRDPDERQAQIQNKTAGQFTSIRFRVLPDGVEVVDRKQPARLIRWADLPEPGGTK